MRPLIIIPTYNERENVEVLIPAIFQSCPEVEILVVDDNSPDGTAACVLDLAQNNPRVHLLSRPGKQGLGKAYLAGFNWGLAQGFDFLVEMDADFSHRPEDLRQLVAQASQYDFVMGSRWVPEGRTVNWGLMRRFISRGGSWYARTILGYPVRDWTGGFNGWHRRVLLKMGLENIQSEGYSFQIELKYRALKLGFRGQELPIVFEDRRVGQSKMSSKIVLEALVRVWQLKAIVK